MRVIVSRPKKEETSGKDTAQQETTGVTIT